MNAAPSLVAYTALVGFVAPRLLLRADWPHRAPALAVAVWHALALSFALGTALTAYNLLMPTEHSHEGLLGLLHSCGLDIGSGGSHPDTAGRLAAALPPAFGVALAGSFTFHVVRARRVRSRHREAVDLVGRRSARLGATVLPYDVPAAYCLPGRRPRIVVSDAAVRALTPEQLAAVLEHERAHIMRPPPSGTRRRGGVPLGLPPAPPGPPRPRTDGAPAGDGRRRPCPARPLRRGPGDRAVRDGGGPDPEGAFAVGGQTVLIRMRRVLGPRRAPHPAFRGSMAAAAAAVPLMPLLVACPLGIG